MAYDQDYGNVIADQKTTYGSNTIPEIWRDQCMHYAMGKALFPQWVTSWEDLAKGPGETLHVPVTDHLARSATTALAHGTGINVSPLTDKRLDVTVAEYGAGLYLNRTRVDFAAPDMPSEALRALGEDWVWTMNNHAAATMFTAGHMCYSVAGAGSFDYAADSAANMAPTGGFTRGFLGGVRDRFVSNSNGDVVPQIEIPGYGEYYCLIMHPDDARGLKNDTDWENLQLYNLNGQGILKSRVGVMEDFVIFETNLGASSGTALAFGADAFALAVATPMELFFYPDYMSDANRAQVWKWYAVFNYALALANIGTHAIKCFGTGA